jgi:Glycosyl transferase family 2
MMANSRTLCLLMQKNERDLLPIWIKYHAALFNIENIVIVDNASTDEEVLHTLKDAALLGARVITRPDPIEQKGEIIGSLIREYDKSGQYTMFLPLDCDEFVGALQGSEAYFDASAINAELEQHREYQGPLTIAGSFYNVPGDIDSFFFWKEDKVFFPANTFKSIDYGFHSGLSQLKIPPRSTSIIHVHYQHKPLQLLRQHAREKLKARVDVDDIDALRSYTGAGSHLVKYFFMGLDHYLKMFDSSTFVQLPRFSNILTEQGLEAPFRDFTNSNSPPEPPTERVYLERKEDRDAEKAQ